MEYGTFAKLLALIKGSNSNALCVAVGNTVGEDQPAEEQISPGEHTCLLKDLGKAQGHCTRNLLHVMQNAQHGEKLSWSLALYALPVMVHSRTSDLWEFELP